MPKDEQSGTDSTITNQDVFENPDKAALTSLATVEDANGIERIVGPAATDWTPAPLEATDQQKKAAKEREGVFEEARKTRLEALKPAETNKDGSIKSSEERSPNLQGDGGSQARVEPEEAKQERREATGDDDKKKGGKG